MLGFNRSIGCNDLHHLATVEAVLLSSDSDNNPKVMLLIATMDQAREVDERKALLHDKSKPKRWPSVR